MTRKDSFRGFTAVNALLACLIIVTGCSADGQYHGGATSVKVGQPYQIDGEWYHPRMVDQYREVGVASWYGMPFHGRKTANGEVYDMHQFTAAHPTLPLPSLARVTNLKNGRSIVVRINDRGPFAKKRIIDLSRRAAWELGFKDQGTTDVEVVYLGLADGLDKSHRQARRSRHVSSFN